MKEREERFEKFWENYQSHSDKVLKEEFKFLKYPICIAGSDQIWNWTKCGDMSPYFLLPSSNKRINISYAASVSDDELPKEYEDVFINGLENINKISVREIHGQHLVSRFTDKNVEIVLDPTLLFGKKFWGGVMSDAIKFNEPYIFSYSLNNSRRYIKSLINYAHKTGMKVLNIRSGSDTSNYKEIVDIYNAGPREFLYLIAHAKFVITNSFHGTAFAINFNIPFVSLLNPYSATNSRIMSITELLNINCRAIMDNDEGSISRAFDEDINFNEVNKILDKWREKSISFLINALSIGGTDGEK